MAFRLRRDTRDWFKEIANSFDRDFDMYYFCLMAGLAARHKVNTPNTETTELVQTFPEIYKKRARLIVGIYLTYELEDLGVAFSDKEQVREAIGRYIDPFSPILLSSIGLDGLNRFSYGGQDTLENWFGEDRPRSIDTFLIKYKRELDLEIKRNPAPIFELT